VRVVQVPEFSRELCGGIHVSRTGDIGLCKVVAEGSISAGVRRIEALTGAGALERFQGATASLARVSQLTHSTEPELVEQVEKLMNQQRTMEKQLEILKEKVAQSQMGGIESQARTIKGTPVLSAQVDGLEKNQMRSLADSLRNKWKSGVIVLAAVEDGNIAIISAVTKDLSAKIHAGKLAASVGQAVGGKGGGRPDMAEAGGKDTASLAAALEQVYASVEAML
jgi:alanyl-tRNA synthetase